MRSIHQHIGENYHRVRLGIGHPGHKDRVAGYVLSDFAKADADWLDDLLRGISDGAAALAAGDGPGFQNAVARRVAPSRNPGAPETVAKPAPKPAQPVKPAPPAAPQSLGEKLQSLAARFK